MATKEVGSVAWTRTRGPRFWQCLIAACLTASCMISPVKYNDCTGRAKQVSISPTWRIKLMMMISRVCLRCLIGELRLAQIFAYGEINCVYTCTACPISTNEGSKHVVPHEDVVLGGQKKIPLNFAGQTPKKWRFGA